MSKYIIKNCPAHQTFYSDTTDGSSSTLCTKGFTKAYCQDCTDCVMKQIVQECQKSIKCFENNEIACPVCNDAASAELAQDILQRLQIEEVE